MCFVLRSRSGVSLLVIAAALTACEPSRARLASPRLLAATAAARTSSVAPIGWRAVSFVRATEGCVQTWTCDCAAARRPGCTVEASADTTTSGACAADSGPLNGCDRCLALEPAVACACRATCP